MGKWGRLIWVLLSISIIFGISAFSISLSGMVSEDPGPEIPARLGESPPSPPRNLEYREEAHQITLEWDPPLDWGDWSDFRGYHVYYEDPFGLPHTADNIRDPEKTSTHKMIEYDLKYWVASETEVNRSDYIGPIIPRDNAGPWVEVLSYPDTVTFGQQNSIMVAVHELNEINRVVFEIWHDGEEVILNRTMDHDGGDSGEEYYSYDFILNQTFSEVSLRVISCDSAGNWNGTDFLPVRTMEKNKPVLVKDRTPQIVMEGEELEFAVEATDDTGLKSVDVIHWREGEQKQQLPLVHSSGDNYTASISVDFDIRPIRYEIRLIDTYNNTFETPDTRTVNVIDVTDPVIEGTWISGVIGTGENITLGINVTDNGEMELIRLFYGFDNSSLESVLAPNGSHTFQIGSDVKSLKYGWEVMDGSDNKNSTELVTIPVKDVIPPTADIIVESDSATTGDPFEIEVVAQDNRNVSDVTILYRFGEDSPISLAFVYDRGDGYTASISIADDAKDFVEYWASVSDDSGNMINTTVYRTDVFDNDPPVLQPIPDQRGTVGQRFHMKIYYRDNIGVTRVVWKDNPGVGEMDKMSFTPTIPVNQLVTVGVYDDSGNYDVEQFMLYIEDTEGGGSYPGTGSEDIQEDDTDFTAVCCGAVFIIIILIVILSNVLQKSLPEKKKEKKPSVPLAMPAARGKKAVSEDGESYQVGRVWVDVREGEDSEYSSDSGYQPDIVEDPEDEIEEELSEKPSEAPPIPDEVMDKPRVLSAPLEDAPGVLAPPPGFEDEE